MASSFSSSSSGRPAGGTLPDARFHGNVPIVVPGFPYAVESITFVVVVDVVVVVVVVVVGILFLSFFLFFFLLGDWFH